MSKTPARVSVLEDGVDVTTGDRQDTYGSMMENMACQEALMEVFKLHWRPKPGVPDANILRAGGAMHHLFGKIARIAGGGVVHRDNFVDGSVYLAATYEALIGEAPDE